MGNGKPSLPKLSFYTGSFSEQIMLAYSLVISIYLKLEIQLASSKAKSAFLYRI